MEYKKIGASLLLTSTLVWSYASQAHYADLNNPKFNVGVTLGHMTIQGNAPFNFTNLTPAGTGARVQKMSNSNVLYGATAGADWFYQRLMIGLGASLEGNQADKAQRFNLEAPIGTFQNAQFQYARGASTQAFIRLGYKIADYMMPYVKAGLNSSRDDMTFTANTVSGIGAGARYNYTLTDRINTPLLGIGLEVPLFLYRFSMRFEYNYIASDEVRMSAPADNGLGTIRVNFRPETHQAKLAWVWNFS